MTEKLYVSPYFPFFPQDWLSSERVNLMTLEEQGAFVRLLSYQWQQGSLPSNIEDIGRLLGVDSQAIARLWHPRLSHVFKAVEMDTGPRLQNTRLEEHRSAMALRSLHFREAGRAGAEKRFGLKPGYSQAKARLKHSVSVSVSGSTSDSTKTKEQKPRKRDEFADAFKAAFDSSFPDAPYVFLVADFVQLASFKKNYPTVTAEQFAEMALWAWVAGDFEKNVALSIKGLCSQWSRLSAKKGGIQKGGSGGEQRADPKKYDGIGEKWNP